MIGFQQTEFQLHVTADLNNVRSGTVWRWRRWRISRNSRKLYLCIYSYTVTDIR